MYNIEYDSTIGNKIISLLDGWVIIDDVVNENSNVIEPFIDDESIYQNNPNKKIKNSEVETFFNSAFQKALMYCNRLNIDDLNDGEIDFFMKGVYYLTASDLWNKYNIRVSNEELEDTYIQSYGGLLYNQSLKILNMFINQKITTLRDYDKDEKYDNGVWLI